MNFYSYICCNKYQIWYVRQYIHTDRYRALQQDCSQNKNSTPEAEYVAGRADNSGVSISTIKRMEDGEVKNFESLIRVLRTLGKLDVFIPLVEEEQLSPNEYYELANQANKPKRKRASKGYTKENKEESEW